MTIATLSVDLLRTALPYALAFVAGMACGLVLAYRAIHLWSLSRQHPPRPS
jgi:hypothetical protein